MTYKIIQQDLKLSLGEKTADIISTTPLGFLIFIPLALIVLVLLPIFIVLALTYENVVEKYYYKWTGKKQRVDPPTNPFKNLPIHVEAESIYMIDGLVEKIEREYNWTDENFRDLELFKFKTIPKITELEDMYFQYDTFVFQDKLILTKVILPELEQELCYLDCNKLTLNTFEGVDALHALKFETVDNELKILMRSAFKKKQLTITFDQTSK